MTPTQKLYTTYIGIDISKNTFVTAVHGNRKTQEYRNNEEGFEIFCKTYEAQKEEILIVMENTGGYERKLLVHLATKDFNVSREHAGRLKNYIRSLGGKAKNDSVDARYISAYAFERSERVLIFKKPDIEREKMRQLSERREDLVKTKKQENARLKSPCAEYVLESIQAHINYLEQQIALLEKEINEILGYEEEKKILQTIPGIGPIIAQTLISFVPELGRISHAQLASLIGLAPYDNQSGKKTWVRRTKGGRGIVREKIYTGAMANIARDNKVGEFYRKLEAKGKPSLVAIIASARKMLKIANAKLRDYYLPIPHKSASPDLVLNNAPASKKG